MPLYEYECKQCHRRIEKILRFSDPEETVCPHCGGALERVISAPAIQFKGAGWYVNDYAKSGAKTTPAVNASGNDGKSSEGSSKDAGKSESGKDSGGSSAAASSSSGSSSAGTSAPASSTPGTTSAPASGSGSSGSKKSE
ncbi:MAG TPA: FmdB family zinc ribbon protein [Acidobacteriaceae bacterium]|jgi:putative FmdB family regulatory protein|nr:FmdB family zinc ribbon protein [Acidobacteriaceae bacterium]